MPLTPKEAVVLAFFKYLDDNNNAAALALLANNAQLTWAADTRDKARFNNELNAFPRSVRKVVYPPAVAGQGRSDWVRVTGSVIANPPQRLNLRMRVNNNNLIEESDNQEPRPGGASAPTGLAAASGRGIILPWPW